MTGANVFISYRSVDAGSAAARLFSDLARTFGREAVFLDRERILPGAAWSEELLNRARASTVMLVVIGKKWLFAQDEETGDRLLNLASDWIRRELEEAITGDVKIVPVLIDDAPVLTERSFLTVPSLIPISQKQAVRLRNADWDTDLKPITVILRDAGLKATFEDPEEAPSAVNYQLYLDRAVQEYDLLDLTTLTQLGADDGNQPRAQLSNLFIPQQVRLARMPQSLPRDYLEAQGVNPYDEEQRDKALLRWSQTTPEPVLGFLSTPTRGLLVILGDPGMGKSSLARHLLLSLLKAKNGRYTEAPHWVRRLGTPTPFLIELKEFTARKRDGTVKDFEDYIEHLGKDQGFGFSAAQTRQLLRQKNALIIFDGLDEIFDPGDRKLCARAIVRFSQKFPANRFIVTSRISGFDAHPFEAARFSIATLDDLSRDAIDTFSKTWFALAYPDQPKQAAQADQDLRQSLNHRPAMRVLAGNPMLLTIMAIVARHERLARSRTGLYAQALKVLCYSWDYRKDLQLPDGSVLREISPDDKIELLRTVAWAMQREGTIRANAIPGAALRSTLEGYFSKSWHLDERSSRNAALEMVELLQTRNWVLTLRGPDLFGFVHRTFLEYLCALDITLRFQSQEIDIKSISKDYFGIHGSSDDWTEILRLLSAMLPVKHLVYIFDDVLIPIDDAPLEYDELVRALHIFSEQDGRRLAQMPHQGEALVRSIWAFLENSARRDSKPIVDSLKVIGKDWPPSTKSMVLPNFESKGGANLLEAVANSILYKTRERNNIIHSLSFSQQLSVRLEALSILITDNGYSNKCVTEVIRSIEEIYLDGTAVVSVVEFLLLHFGASPALDALILEMLSGDHGQLAADEINHQLFKAREPVSVARHLWTLATGGMTAANKKASLKTLSARGLHRYVREDIGRAIAETSDPSVRAAFVEFAKGWPRAKYTHERALRDPIAEEHIGSVLKIFGNDATYLTMLQSDPRWLEQFAEAALPVVANHFPGLLRNSLEAFLVGANEEAKTRLFDRISPVQTPPVSVRQALLRAARISPGNGTRSAAYRAIGRLPKPPSSYTAAVLSHGLNDLVKDVRLAAVEAWAIHRYGQFGLEFAPAAFNLSRPGHFPETPSAARVKDIAKRSMHSPERVLEWFSGVRSAAQADLAEASTFPKPGAGAPHANQ